ncbi:nucleoside hydrolase [Ignatzschineria larvae DSM 13226]|uniref:Nucleoside hydrolase n=1 Tax=Ignatzschineria larvae DSM 13226 TaxID=1111732 RepID=A0ABZ3BY03_9GAMM|nr:nucleoside hydrolase [Ignatzschineria larvae]
MTDIRKKVIFDTDPGIDDAMAILFAEAHESIDLIGITTVFGNATIENGTRNALFIKKKFGLKADVVQGADIPLVIEPGEPTVVVHGDNGLGNIEIPDEDFGEVDPRSAHDYIIDQVKANPHEITIIAVGRLTNLALAMQKDPSIIPLVKEIVVMGGAFGFHGHTGNVTPFAEANILGDPHAADIVFTAPWPVVVVGLDVTQLSIMDPQYLETLRDSSEKYGDFIYQISRYYADFHKKSVNLDGFFVHDASAVAYAIDPSLFTTKKGNIRVVTEGPAIGHTMFKGNPRVFPVDEWSNKPLQHICVDVNNDAFLELYMKTLVG